MISKEEWKDIYWTCGKYQVSNCGRVKSLNYRNTGKEHILKQSKRRQNGYMVLRLCGSTVYVHRLVFEAFYRRLLPNEDCHHINSIRDCNLSTNLVARIESIHVAEHNKSRVVSQQTRRKQSEANIGKKHSQQTKRKLSESHKGRKHTEEEKRKQSEAMKKYYETHDNHRKGKMPWNKGLKHSQQTKRKMSESKKIKLLYERN